MRVKTLINVIPYEDDTRYKRVTYEQVKKACGKRSCRTCGGERLAHGPYWYKCEWDADGRKKRTVYVGKELPAEAEEALLAKRFLSDPTFRTLVHQTQDLHDDLSRRKKENAFLHQRIARLNRNIRHWHTRRSVRCAHVSPARRYFRAHGARYCIKAQVHECTNLLWSDLEAELAEARARAPRADLSGAVRLERASKVYRKARGQVPPGPQPCDGRGNEGFERVVASAERHLSRRAGRWFPPRPYPWRT